MRRSPPVSIHFPQNLPYNRSSCILSVLFFPSFSFQSISLYDEQIKRNDAAYRTALNRIHFSEITNRFKNKPSCHPESHVTCELVICDTRFSHPQFSRSRMSHEQYSVIIFVDVWKQRINLGNKSISGKTAGRLTILFLNCKNDRMKVTHYIFA